MKDAAQRVFGKLTQGWSASRTVIVLLVVFGVVLRLQGQFWSPSGLWFDEAVWARRVIERSPFSHNIRPFAFMGLTKALCAWFGATEFWLRFVPNVTGIGTVLLAPYVASRLFKSNLARVLAVLLIAIHPALNDLSKEFKPYSSDAFIHLGTLALFLRYRETQSKGWLLALACVLPLLLPFSFSAAFLYPGVLLLLLIDRFKQRGLRGAALPIVSGLLCLGVTLATYFLLHRNVANEEAKEHWGYKYDVFFQSKAHEKPDSAGEPDDEAGEQAQPAPSAATNRVVWLLEKHADVAAFPGLRSGLWKLPKAIPMWWRAADRWLWLTLHVAGLAALVWRRRWTELTLLALPLAMVSACNALGFWPIGVFRTNLFLCVYAVLIASAGADAVLTLELPRVPRAATLSLHGALVGAVLAFYLLPGLTFGFDWSGRKQTFTTSFDAKGIFKQLRQQREWQLQQDPAAPKATVLVCGHTSSSYWFYLDHHPGTRARYGQFFRDNFYPPTRLKGVGRSVSKQLRKPDAPPVFVVVSKMNLEKVRFKLRRAGRVLKEAALGTDHLVALVAPNPAKR